MSEEALANYLRSRIVAGLHVGHLRPGSRLPSLREVARETGADHRVAAAAYRRLEAEGLVDVRPRSGVYLAEQEKLNEKVMAESARWLAGVFTDAWVRRIALPEFVDFVRLCTTRVYLGCAVVESNEDQRTGLVRELAVDFGLDAYGVEIPDRPEEPLPPETAEAIEAADLLVTSSFHAQQLDALPGRMDRPLVVAHLNPGYVSAVESALADGAATFLVADPRFADRLRVLFPDAGRRLHVVFADDAEAVEALSADEPIFLTRAARERIGERPLRLAFPHSPSISPEAAREICAWIIRLNTTRSARKMRR